MPEGYYLAFDYGLKRIGVAVGQTLTGKARPLLTIQNLSVKKREAAIQELINEWQPKGLVVGKPYHMDGSESDMGNLTAQFASRLLHRFQLPVFEVDERLTSQMARSDAETDKGRGLQEKYGLDSMAAQLILEQWLKEHNA